jgi:acyl-CoA thioesterase FadM
VHIQYRSPAAWGEKLSVATGLVELKSTGGTWYIDMERQADREPIARCLLEWSVTDRGGNQAMDLPEALFGALKDKVGAAGAGS